MGKHGTAAPTSIDEVGVNHSGDLWLVLELVDAAARDSRGTSREPMGRRGKKARETIAQ